MDGALGFEGGVSCYDILTRRRVCSSREGT